MFEENVGDRDSQIRVGLDGFLAFTGALKYSAP